MGRKALNPAMGAMTPARRKREQLDRQWERVQTLPDTEWTDRECLMVLSTARYPHGSPMDKGAWQQLGRLRGFIKK
jgi:hypothetical protein